VPSRRTAIPARLLRHAGARVDAGDIRTGKSRVDGQLGTSITFAASLLFSYVESFLYDATRRWPNAARRRSRSTRRSCARSSADAECASCSTAESMDAVERELQRPRIRALREETDAVHDLLLSIGDLSSRRSTAERLADVAAASDDSREAGPRDHATIGGPGGDVRYVSSETPRAIATHSASRCARPAPSLVGRRASARNLIRATRGRTRPSPRRMSSLRFGLNAALVETVFFSLRATARSSKGNPPRRTTRE